MTIPQYKIALFGVAVTVFLITMLVIPFLFKRNDDQWHNYITALEDTGQINELKQRYLQLNTDALHWVLITSNFPYSYRTDNLRVNRPVYPAICSLIARTITLVTNPIEWRSALTKPTNFKITVAAMFFVNLLIMLGSVQLFFSLLCKYVAQEKAFSASLLLSLSPWWLWQANTAATSVIAVGIIVLVLYLFNRMLSKQDLSWDVVFLYSLLIGVMMLAKMQYDVVITCWILLVLRRRWMLLAGTFVFHLIPFAAYSMLLQQAGIHYRNIEVELYGQGVWMFELVAQQNWTLLLNKTWGNLAATIKSMFIAFSAPVLVVAIYGYVRNSSSYREMRIVSVTGVLVVMGFLIAIDRIKPYLAFDAFFAILPLAALGIYSIAADLTSSLKNEVIARRTERLIVTFFFIIAVPLSWYVYIPDKFTWQPIDSFNEVLFKVGNL